MPAAAKHKMVTAVFRDRFKAHSAYDWLLDQGHMPKEINLLMAESTKRKYYSDEARAETSSHAMEGMAAGGAVGTAVGATAAAIAAIGTSLVVPGMGLSLAASSED